MIELRVAVVSAFMKPSTTASTATRFAGFLDRAALGTILASCLGWTCRRGRFCGHVGVTINQGTQTQL